MDSGNATRRDFLKTAGLGVAASVAASQLAGPARAAPKRPNFVWLISEDNSTHYMKLFNEKGAVTPRIAELAEDGVIFRHAFSNCPVCSAARSTLETGCYGSRIGTHFHRKFKTVPLPDGLRMFPAYLRQAGYYTSNKKKTDYNFIAKKGGWDSSKDWRGRKDGQPFFHKQSFATTHEGKLHRVKLKGPLSEKEKRTFVHPYFPDTPLFRKTAATYHALHRKMDGEIGRVVDLGRGTDADGFVSFIDFGPTLLHLAGLDVPDEVVIYAIEVVDVLTFGEELTPALAARVGAIVDKIMGEVFPERSDSTGE